MNPSLPVKAKKTKKDKIHFNDKITNKLLEQAHQQVMQTKNYGEEGKLITDAFRRFPDNTDLVIVVFKIGPIYITNSTNISRYKSQISAVELV